MGGWVSRWVSGTSSVLIVPLVDLSCKLRLVRFSSIRKSKIGNVTIYKEKHTHGFWGSHS